MICAISGARARNRKWHSRVASLDDSVVTAIDGRALRSEDKWTCALKRPLQKQFVERTPGKSASAGESSTKGFIEAVRLDVFTPPGSPFDRTQCRSFSSEHE